MVNTDNPSVSDLTDVDYVIGDHYDDTANWSLVDVAEQLSRDLIAVQDDGMVTDNAEFEARADESGPRNVMRVRVSGLSTPVAPVGFDVEIIRNTIRAVVELASHYNRVERARPDRCRFILVVDVVSEGGATIGGFIGTMQFQDW